jgi:hypothetical protein
MIKSKLFDVLGSLEENEFRKFGDFIKSPYFNKSKVIIKLYRVYSGFYPEFSGEKFTKMKVFKSAFPGKAFSEVTLRNYNSDMLKLAETFLAYHNFGRNPNNRNVSLLSELNIRNIRPLFESNYISAIKALETAKERDTAYYYNRYRLQQENDSYLSYVNNFSADVKHDCERSVINYTLSVITEMYSYFVNQKTVLKKEYDFLMLDELKELIDKKPGLLEPVVWMHYNRLMLLLTGAEKYYLVLKELAETNGSLTDTTNHFDTYICLINYVRKHKDPESVQTTRELFELRKAIIEKNILEGKNYLSHNVFYNQVKSGLKLKEYKWVLNFIESYKHKLVDRVKENTYNFCLGYYYYETGDITNALMKLSLVTGKSDTSLEVKNLLTKISWDEGNYDRLFLNIAAYRQYLAKNRKLDTKTIKKHTGFIKILEKMFRHRYDGKELNIDEQIKLVKESDYYEKSWLEDRLGRMF